MAVAEDTTTTDRRIELSETDLEKKVGDYLYRLRQASTAKFYDHFLHYGGITINPKENEYRIRGIDGEVREPIPREDYAIEELVAQFDKALENALNDL